MNTQRIDPRVKRTRQLLQDSFKSLIREKDFKSITVRDITEKATVNRATFYAHFTDKYELLDSIIIDDFRDTLKQRLDCQVIFSEETISKLLLVMCDYHKNLSTLCPSRYQSLGQIIENKIIGELQELITNLLLQTSIKVEKESIRTISSMLSWGIYGATYSWNSEGRKIKADVFVSYNMPIIMNGVGLIFKSN